MQYLELNKEDCHRIKTKIMKIIKILLVVASIFAISTVNSQNLTDNEVDKKEERMRVFTMEEFSNIHIWFMNQVNAMGMNDKLQLEYDTLLAFYNEKITRLNKEKDIKSEEYIKNMKLQILELNSRVEPILSAEQNKKHLEIMRVLERAVVNKLTPKQPNVLEEDQEEYLEESQIEEEEQKEDKNQEDKIGIFTLDEFSNLHIWLVNQVKEMEMDDELQLEYDTLWSFYIEKITRMDKEKGVSAEEYIENMNAQIVKLNSRLEPILTAEQNKKHLSIMSNLGRAVENKLLNKE